MSEFLAEDVVDGQRVITTKNIEGTVQQNNAYSTDVLVEVSDGVYQRCIAVKDFGGGSGGTTDYSVLENKPQINDVTLSGNKSSSDLGLQDELVSGTNIKTINGSSVLGSGNLSVDDPNTYKSLSQAQETTLLADGTYEGSVVANGTIFTRYDGTFQSYSNVLTPGGSSYDSSAEGISSDVDTIATDTTVVRAFDNGVVMYTENGLNWSASKISGSDFNANVQMFGYGAIGEIWCLSDNSGSKGVYSSTDGGKTWTSKGTISIGNNPVFLGYIQSSGMYVALFANNADMYDYVALSTDLANWSYPRLPGWPNHTFSAVGGAIQYDANTIGIFDNTNGMHITLTSDFDTYTNLPGTIVDVWGGAPGSKLKRVGAYLTVGTETSKFAYSTDGGNTWTSNVNSSTFYNGMLDYDETNELYISVKSGNMYSSTDLLTGWQEHDFMSYSTALPVVHFDGKFVVSMDTGSAVIPTASAYVKSLTPLSYNKTSIDATAPLILSSAPDSSVDGVQGQLAIYNGNAYVCVDGSNTWKQFTS